MRMRELYLGFMTTEDMVKKYHEQERLNGLALMHINNDIKVDVDEVIAEFAWTNKARMRFNDILDDGKEENNSNQDNSKTGNDNDECGDDN